MHFLFFILVGLMADFQLVAQNQDPKTGYFLVEEDILSPPDSAIISHYIGRPAMAFAAKDMNGVEQYLGNYLGQLTLLLFWKTSDSACTRIIGEFDHLQRSLTDRVALISFAKEDRNMLKAFLENKQLGFPIIPNAGILGSAAYADDLGYPRLFFVDAKGIIQNILPADFFRHQTNAIDEIQSLILAQRKQINR